MDWKEANSDFIFSEKLEKIIKNNAHLYNMDSPEKFIQYILRIIKSFRSKIERLAIMTR